MPISKNHRSLFILLFLALMASLCIWPPLTRLLDLVIISLVVYISLFYTRHKHWKSNQQAEYTREKMLRNLALDAISLLLALAAAILAGGPGGGQGRKPGCGQACSKALWSGSWRPGSCAPSGGESSGRWRKGWGTHATVTLVQHPQSAAEGTR